MGVRYSWEREHDEISNRIDTDARVLDRIAKRYSKEFDKELNKAIRMFGSNGRLDPMKMHRSITIKQREVLRKSIRGWLKSGIYEQDKTFTNKMNRVLHKPNITREEFLALNFHSITSRIRLEQKGKLLRSMYQTWLDSERTVARLTNVAFTRAGDDFIFKRIGANFQGTSMLSRFFHQASEMVDQFMYAVRIAMNKGADIKGMALVVRYFFSKGDYRAKRILLTESTRISTEAKQMAFEKSGVKYYQYISVMDDRTSKICVGLDLHIYKVSKMRIGENAPPTHPNCRSSIKAYFIDDQTGETGNYPIDF